MLEKGITISRLTLYRVLSYHYFRTAGILKSSWWEGYGSIIVSNNDTSLYCFPFVNVLLSTTLCITCLLGTISPTHLGGKRAPELKVKGHLCFWASNYWYSFYPEDCPMLFQNKHNPVPLLSLPVNKIEFLVLVKQVHNRGVFICKLGPNHSEI